MGKARSSSPHQTGKRPRPIPGKTPGSTRKFPGSAVSTGSESWVPRCPRLSAVFTSNTRFAAALAERLFGDACCRPRASTPASDFVDADDCKQALDRRQSGNQARTRAVDTVSSVTTARRRGPTAADRSDSRSWPAGRGKGCPEPRAFASGFPDSTQRSSC